MITIMQRTLILIVVLCSCSAGDGVVRPKVKPLVEAVYASGYLVARGQYDVFSQVEGYVVERVAPDGTTVRKGDPVFVLEGAQQSSRYDLARKTYDIARDNYETGSSTLREVEAALAASKTKFSFDSVNFVRYSNLLARNATSRAEFDRIKLMFDNSRNEYTAQQGRFQRTKNQLYLELQNAKSQLEIARNESGKYVVTSDIDGKVFRTLKEEGELVRRGEAVAVIGDARTYYLELSVDEMDIQRIKIGQQILVTMDAFPGKVFNASLEKIYPIVNPQQQSLRVDAVLLDSLPDFYSGLAVEANIVIRRNSKALVLPKSAVQGDTVTIETDDGVKQVRVKTGIQTFDEIEIVTGLDSNSLVVLK
jgi:HlyD family secretion protein